jgi:hypothetical protein
LRTARAAVAFGIALAFVVLGFLLSGAAPLRGEDRGAERTRYQAPVYPDDLLKQQRQGNVLLTGRIDAQGSSRICACWLPRTSSSPAAEAVRARQFRPATRDGKPVEIFANVGVRFRLRE